MRAVEYDPGWGWIARCHKSGKEIGIPDFRWRTRDVARCIVEEHAMLGCDCATRPTPAAEGRRCECFGNSGLHASTHNSGDGLVRCDMCGWPIQEGAVDVLTAVNSTPAAEGG